MARSAGTPPSRCRPWRRRGQGSAAWSRHTTAHAATLHRIHEHMLHLHHSLRRQCERNPRRGSWTPSPGWRRRATTTSVSTPLLAMPTPPGREGTLLSEAERVPTRNPCLGAREIFTTMNPYGAGPIPSAKCAYDRRFQKCVERGF